MTVRSILLVLLALVFGGSVAFGINTLLKQRQAPAAEVVPVVIAAQDIGRFASLSEDMLKIRQYPKELVPPGSLRTIAEAANRVTAVSLIKGETISSVNLSAKGSGKGMGAIIPKGLRAFTIKTPTVESSVAGFIFAGSKVDVILTVKEHAAAGGTTTTTLLQNLEILAVDQHVDAPAKNKSEVKELRSVTLLVTPEQAEKLDNGQTKGTLHLALRNPHDAEGKSPSLSVKEKPAVPETVAVVVAAKDVEQFAKLSEDMLTIRQYPKDLVPPGSVRTIAEVKNRETSVALVKGDLISTARLDGKKEPTSLNIPMGMRAFTINAPTLSPNGGGYVQPGSRVDVLLTVKERSTDKSGGNKTSLLQNLKVLAVDRVESSNGKGEVKDLRSVTLLIKPDQAIDLAQTNATFHLTLRNPNDQTGLVPPASVQRQTPALIRTIRGVENNLVELR